MIPLASAIPNSGDGYVAAAYIVFFAIVLIYVAIMAVRLGRVERKVEQLRTVQHGEHGDADPDVHARTSGVGPGGDNDGVRERETV
jgi:hypothetical protein